MARLGARYKLRFDEGIFAKKGFLAGDDERRRAELLRALHDPEVEAIVAARGGYGATRLLEGLEPKQVAAARKLLVGFSDITALHALWARAGLRSIHGPMVARLGAKDEGYLLRWIDAVEGAVHEPLRGLRPIAEGRGGAVRGPLLGGNLAVLSALVGTPFAPPLDGAILFLEDVGERPYRVDRMLTTLKQAGWLERLAGVALGAFTDSGPGPDAVAIDEVLADRLEGLGIPVVSGLPAGHVEDNLELPLGAMVRLDAAAGTLIFEEGATAP